MTMCTTSKQKSCQSALTSILLSMIIILVLVGSISNYKNIQKIKLISMDISYSSLITEKNDYHITTNNSNNSYYDNEGTFYHGGAPNIHHGISHILPSIPVEHLIPPKVINDDTIDTFIANWTKGVSPHLFFTYNPSLVPLPPRYRDAFNNMSANPMSTVVYLVSYRVSNMHSCGFDPYPFWENPVDYFALALLDKNLNLIDGSDVVFNLKQGIGNQAFQDVRLFSFGEHIYFSSHDYLMAVDVFPPGYLENKHRPKGKKIQPLWGNGLELFCASPQIIRIHNREGKNFQFFQLNKTNNINEKYQVVLLEYWPYLPRTIVEIELSPKSATEIDVFESLNNPVPIEDMPHASQSLLSQFFKRDRGTACCVPIQRKYYADLIESSSMKAMEKNRLWREEFVLVGIAHTKTKGRVASINGVRYKNLSRLYAFSPRQPYHLVLRSALFCFGFAEGGDPLNKFTSKNRLDLEDVIYNCPNIHFASGMLEKVGDDSKIIVSYGINDCTPHIVEINKRDFMIPLMMNSTWLKKGL